MPAARRDPMHRSPDRTPTHSSPDLSPSMPARDRRSALLATLAAAFIALMSQASVVRGAPDTTPLDSIARRAAACTGCHGKEGRAAADGFYPRIAGKPAGYLREQLLHFRDGRRQHAAMAHLLAHLTDDYLGELGDYFAGLDVPYAAPRPATLSAATRERGRALIESGDATRDIPACVRCHGEALLGVAPGVPGLLGLPRDYLNAQLGAWQTGLRHARAPDCMAKIASRLAPSDIEAVSAWLASHPVPTGGKPATAFTQRPPLTCGSIPGADRR